MPAVVVLVVLDLVLGGVAVVLLRRVSSLREFYTRGISKCVVHKRLRTQSTLEREYNKTGWSLLGLLFQFLVLLFVVSIIAEPLAVSEISIMLSRVEDPHRVTQENRVHIVSSD